MDERVKKIENKLSEDTTLKRKVNEDTSLKGTPGNIPKFNAQDTQSLGVDSDGVAATELYNEQSEKSEENPVLFNWVQVKSGKAKPKNHESDHESMHTDLEYVQNKSENWF